MIMDAVVIVLLYYGLMRCHRLFGTWTENLLSTQPHKSESSEIIAVSEYFTYTEYQKIRQDISLSEESSDERLMNRWQVSRCRSWRVLEAACITTCHQSGGGWAVD